MTDLADFLLARIAEDEAAARTATSLGYGWDADGLAGDVYASGDDPQTGTLVAEAGERTDADHIARWDPARVLAECEAKRRIVDEHAGGGGYHCDVCSEYYGPELMPQALPCPTLRFLALPYADHDQYREEWRP